MIHHLAAETIAFGLLDLTNTRDVFSLNAGLSILDNEAQAFAWSSGDTEFAAAHRAFATAAYTYRRSDNDDTKWLALLDAAERLALFLAPLGGTVAPHCQRPAAHGTCDAVIIRGQCTSSFGHTDDTGTPPDRDIEGPFHGADQ